MRKMETYLYIKEGERESIRIVKRLGEESELSTAKRGSTQI